MPGEVSSTMVRMGRRWLVTRASPEATITRAKAVRVCSMDMNSPGSEALNAQVSTTCWPWVLMTLTSWPASSRQALPWRAGIASRYRVSMSTISGNDRGSSERRLTRPIIPG